VAAKTEQRDSAGDPLAIASVMAALAGQCQSERAAKQAAQSGVCKTIVQANERLALTDEALFLLDTGAQPAIANDIDHTAALDLAERAGVLGGDQLRAIGLAIRCGEQVRALAESWPEDAERLRELALAPPRLSLLANLLCEAIDERGELHDDASPELARLRAEVRRRSGGLRRRIAEMVKETDADGLLQDDYYTVRDGRYVLPIKASDKRVLGGIVHGSSQTGATVYIEPQEMVEANNALSLANDEVKREERRILTEFSASVARHSGAIEEMCAMLAQLDEVAARGRLAQQFNATRPTLGGLGDGLRLRGLRHPLLLLAGAAIVANDVELSASTRWLIVSGPNGGGKTVLLTSVGLAVEMARRGLHVCCREGSNMPFAQHVHVVLGDAQDIEVGHSTFSGHLARLTAALEAARKGPSLVLLDELASGTEPMAGSALARAILEAFADLPCFGFVATHFEALKLLPLQDERYANAALALDAETLRPTFALRIGAAGSSSPLALAERLGVPQGVIERARQLIGAGSVETEQTLKRLQQLQQQTETAHAEAERERSIAKEARRRLQEQRRFEKQAAQARIQAAAKDALVVIEQAKQAAKAARKRLQRSTSSSEIEQQATELVHHIKVVQGHKEAAEGEMRQAPKRPPVTVDELKPGVAVHHNGLGVDVEVIELSKDRKKARVKAGVMELDAKIADLGKALNPPRKPTKKERPRETPKPPKVATDAFDDEDHTADFRTGEWTCDLRGKRVEEGMEQVDRHIDRAVVAGVRGVCIVHGHGTGAMRKAVTDYLRRHNHVLRSRLGGQGEGGAGATMVWMKR
jgi:DNA mismatch repair protein MutS2